MKTCLSVWALAFSVCFVLLATLSDAVRVVYSRAYAGRDLGVARKYHAMYFQYARLSSYIPRTTWFGRFPCGNFEANSFGEYLGFFSCNFHFEPSYFDYCCGIQGAHYCCPNASLATPYLSDPDANKNSNGGASNLTNTGIGIGVFVGIMCVVIIIVRFFYFSHFFGRNSQRRMTAAHSRSGTVVIATISSGATYPRQPNSSPAEPLRGVANESFAMRPEPFAPPPYPGPEAPPPSYQSVTDGTAAVVVGNQPPAYRNKDS